MEHGYEGHARNLYREVTETPLIIILPFLLKPGIVVEEPASNIDIMPTILDLVGLPPLPHAKGRSLVSQILAEANAGSGGQQASSEVPRISHLDRSWGKSEEDPDEIISIVDGKFRMIYQVNKPEATELYDRSIDPKEQVNIASAMPGVVDELSKEIEAYLADRIVAWGENKEIEMDEMHKNQLKALGYVIH